MATSTPANDFDAQRRDLCARMFLEPQRFDAAARLVDAALLRTQPHIHEDVLQLDLALSCGGSVQCDGLTVPVKAISAFAFYPNATHAHDLKITSYESEVLTLKLSADPNWPAMRFETFAKISHAPANAAVMIRAFRRLAWLSVTSRNHSLASLATLAELISLWPGSDAKAQPPSGSFEPSTRLDPVLKLIDRSLTAPPNVRAMARAAALSPRQLMRHFAAMMGCTPHEYVTRQRLARAKEMLASGQMNVTEVAEALGFANIHGFSRWFFRETKVNPSEFRIQPSTL